METENRVVVTGMGIVAPNGIGLDAFWDSLIHCKSGVGPITLFDTSDYPLKIAGEVKNFDLRDYLGDTCKPKRLARQTQMGLAACKMALDHAQLDRNVLEEIAPLNLVMGICSAGVDVTEQAKEAIMTRGPKRVRPHIVGSCQPHAVSSALVQMMGVQTYPLTISSACPSGLDAVVAATKLIREGKADLVIVGAADSPLNGSTVASFCTAGIPSLSTEFPPEEVSRPFDAERSGAVLGEGAGFLILERFDSALARNATPYMEILAGANMADAPGASGMEGMFHAMSIALKNAGIYKEQVDYICANAVSDVVGDRVETEWIKKQFGSLAYKIPVSSIRGVMGHPLAPAGIFQLIACALSLEHQIVVPTANLHTPDPACDLDFVPLKFRRSKLDILMANGHGMGGENSSVLVRRVL